MKNKHSILLFNLIEPLHNGSGQGLGVIDRPIIRETPTGFPIIQPSTIKGVLRNRFEEIWDKAPDTYKVTALFGPDKNNAHHHAGAVSFGEGQLLAFPVRSLKGLFVWITCPKILARFQQRLRIAGLVDTGLEELIKSVSQPDVFYPLIIHESRDIILVGEITKGGSDNRELVLEEFTYQVQDSKDLVVFAKSLADALFDKDSYWEKEMAGKLVVMPDDSFTYFVNNATEVVANIEITDSGTTNIGSLRYTEYLPRESIMYSLVSYDKAHPPVWEQENEDDIKRIFEGLTEPEKTEEAFASGLQSGGKQDRASSTIMQIGGDETTGKGLVQVKIFRAEKNNA